MAVKDMAVGKCPECSEPAVFLPTRKKDVFVCDVCLEQVKQHVNGKISWFKLSDPPLGGPVKY